MVLGDSASSVMIGKRSVLVEWSCSLVLHRVIDSFMWAEQKTLSGLVRFFVVFASSVEILPGSAISILYAVIRSSSGCAATRFSFVKRW
jgi:hypothetical protein